jgi:hypothetical protein
MRKKNKHPAEFENEVSATNSDNVIENKKYIKKLELQRLVLKKIVDSEQNHKTTRVDPVSHDSN